MTPHALVRTNRRWRWIPTKDVKPRMRVHSHPYVIIWDTNKGTFYYAHCTPIRYQ